MTSIMTFGGILLFIIGVFAIKMHINKKHESKCDCGCCHCKDKER